MDVAAFHRSRSFAGTSFGRVACVERGQGPAALLLHGAPLNGFQWRHCLEGLADLRRCIAPDLMGLGYSEIAVGQDLSFPNQARMLEELLDVLGVDRVDLVGSDAGGAVAQIFAARHPERVRSLMLTNCPVQDAWPPVALAPVMGAAGTGVLDKVFRSFLNYPRLAYADYCFGRPYAEVATALPEDVLRVYLEPLLASDRRIADATRFFLSQDAKSLLEVESALRRLRAPALLLWGEADPYFPPHWAERLRTVLPACRALRLVPGAKLFFPEERPELVCRELREHWTAAASSSGG